MFHFENYFSNYFGEEPIVTLSRIQDFILELDMFVELKENSTLYRCRQHKIKNEIKIAEDLASAPNIYSKANGRMNPAGISMFYCSKSKELTIKEVVDKTDKEKPFYTVGIFRNINALKLVDLTNLPEEPSIYDSEKNRNIDIIRFFKEFTEDVVKPIKSTDSIIEYIPTQIVTEYIRFNPTLDVDGIIYPSSKDSTLKNIVLFYDHEESIKELNFSKTSLKTTTI